MKFLDAIADPKKHVIVQTAPAVRAGLARNSAIRWVRMWKARWQPRCEELVSIRYSIQTGQRDLTIMEEATEFLDRVQNGGVLPMITSCSPGWIKYCEHYFPDMTENLSYL